MPEAIHDALDINLVFDRIRGTWAGLCDITIVATEDLIARIAADTTCASALADIVTESCANAIRHAHATYVTVAITQPAIARLVYIDIDTDGDPLGPISTTGLGSELLDVITLEWHLESRPSGTRLTAILPTEPGRTHSSSRRYGARRLGGGVAGYPSDMASRQTAIASMRLTSSPASISMP
jgi:hypothetical protein